MYIFFFVKKINYFWVPFIFLSTEPHCILFQRNYKPHQIYGNWALLPCCGWIKSKWKYQLVQVAKSTKNQNTLNNVFQAKCCCSSPIGNNHHTGPQISNDFDLIYYIGWRAVVPSNFQREWISWYLVTACLIDFGHIPLANFSEFLHCHKEGRLSSTSSYSP